jgi:hypothetical protein
MSESALIHVTVNGLALILVGVPFLFWFVRTARGPRKDSSRLRYIAWLFIGTYITVGILLYGLVIAFMYRN